MASPSFWNFTQNALRRKMVSVLVAHGLPNHDAEAWAALTFAQYDSFQNLSGDDLSTRSYEILQTVELGVVGVELKHLHHVMQGEEIQAKIEIWNDFVRIHTGRALMAHYAKIRSLEFDRLVETQREALLQGGISAADWNVIRRTSPTVVDGVEYLTPKTVPGKEPSQTYAVLVFRAADDVFGGISAQLKYERLRNTTQVVGG